MDYLGDDFRICRIPFFTWFDIGYIFPPVYGGPGTWILRSILVLLFLFPCTAHCLVRPWIQILRQSTENFMFFYVNWWITDPEVDS